ncbi:hypothetical protein GCM10027048_20460 [Hymenobacter coalescens]
MSNKVQRLAQDVYVLRGARAVVEFTAPKSGQDVINGADELKQGGLVIAPWGKNNLKPQEMLKLYYANHLKPQLLVTARDFLLGARVGVFEPQIRDDKRVLVPVIDTEMEAFYEFIDGDTLLRSSAFNLEFAANYFSVVELENKTNVAGADSFDCTDVRALVTTKRYPEKYGLHPDWSNFKAKDVKILPAYDRTNPGRFGQFIYHGRDWTPGQKYYDLPPHWGGEQWLQVSNKVPKFHISGLENGYDVRWHIKIPKDYFLQFGDAKKQQEAEDALLEEMESYLAGAENAGKAFVSKYTVDERGNAKGGFIIEPIDSKANNEAYEKVNQQANIAHVSAHGIDPSLAGIDTGAKLGGSGSEKRISYQLHLAQRTPNKRKILLEQLNVMKKIQGLNPSRVYGFEDMDITTLAETPKGQKEKTNPQ